MDNGIGKWILSNLSNIIVVVLLVILYFGFKKSEQRIGEMNQRNEEMQRRMNQRFTYDSIRSQIEQRQIDSIHSFNKNLFKEVDYIKNQNDVIYNKNQKFFDQYNDIAIDRPDF